ncbi:MAG: histidine phosphatase family protein [Proteobacteria bacterium]|nr:histidine phosphatase family protein [Pseudomonadota bacterium]MDA1023222.1 histidine phosphatase family protein [Pseudomonadota bacterium]
MLDQKSFYFLRHGQTDWNKERRLQGSNDIPLNATGIDQAHGAKDLLAETPITTICCSPMNRARKTAEIVNEVLNCPLVFIDELRECSFGENEGTLLSDENYEDVLRGAGGWGGEVYEEFLDRAISGINQALSHPGPVLIVCHGGIYWSLLVNARLEQDKGITNGIPMRFDPPADGKKVWAAALV